VADLGTGGGVPGLVLADRWTRARVVCVESSVRRAAWLGSAATRLDLADRVEVHGGRAEEAARRDLRETCDVVVARSFGPPAMVAECAVALLRPNGALYVSEPATTDADRWPSRALGALGYAPAEILLGPAVDDGSPVPHPVRVARLRRQGALADRWPRTASALQKRPLWRA
jgi:16S rRNA (guanine527-N7)-methyltransferase